MPLPTAIQLEPLRAPVRGPKVRALECGSAATAFDGGGTTGGRKREKAVAPLPHSKAGCARKKCGNSWEPPSGFRRRAGGETRKGYAHPTVCRVSTRLLKRLSVMLSAAKHLLYLTENKQKQIPSLRSGQALRCAQDDIVRGFFSSLPS